MTIDNAMLRVEDIYTGKALACPLYLESEIRPLAASIDKKGLIYPLVVWKDGGKHRLIDGHKRLQAIQYLMATSKLACARWKRDGVPVRVVHGTFEEAQALTKETP